MVKRVAENSISEDDGDTQHENQNERELLDNPNKNTKKRLKTKSLYRQPTVNELNRLQETENLFNSNLFRLQVEEILQEVKVKEKTEKKFEIWFNEFKEHLLSIPEDSIEYDLTEQVLTKKLKVKLPISNKLVKTKCVFRFHKFRDIKIVGSYLLGCSLNSKLRVDIQITVPADTYTKNDSINYRYHKKRAAYLAVIASHIRNHSTVENVTYTWLNGCETKPVLDFSPTGALNKKLLMRIHLTCEEEAYKLHRFSPSRNNLREAWLFSESVESNDVGPPTSYYNCSVLSDLTASQNENFLIAVLLKTDNLKQAIILLKIWLRQRNLQVSGYIVCMLVSYLVQMKRINNLMSSYQIVRNVWIAMKSSEWDVKGISLHKGDKSPPIEEFHKHFPVVFLDVTGYYNICWQMCKGTYYGFRRESALAVDMLDNSNLNSFLPLFMVPVKPLMQFDHILRFKNIQMLKKVVIEKTPRPVQVNYGVDDLYLVIDMLYSLLTKGLGNRVDLILQIVEADFSWSVKKKPEKINKEESMPKLSFGLILNPENCLNIVEKGPPANLPEAEEFRAFWGDKSELRRFQDGSITETCVWSGDSFAERRTVTRQIIDYLLHLKYDIPSSDLFHVFDQLESLLCRKEYNFQCEEASLNVLRAFDELRNDMRGLAAGPLDVSAVYGVSPVFSYCEPLAPACRAPRKPWRRGLASLAGSGAGGGRLPDWTPAYKAVVELGHSGKWPGDIQAFRCLKAAFHLQIADQLHKQYSLPTHAYPTHLDVLKNGLVFRLEIAHPKEITLLRKEMEDGVAKFRETDESVKLQCETVLLPRLRGALHGLHQKHPSFGPTVCLFKRWLSSHLLSPPHFPSTLAELMVASTFLHPHPLTPTIMPTIGLLRVLRLLAEKDWTREMVILDFNGDMKREEILELESKFSSREQPSSGEHIVHIVTSYDGELPGVWGARAPGGPVLARGQALARSALHYLTAALLDHTDDHVLQIFVPSLAGFDVLIRLRAGAGPRGTERARPPAPGHGQGSDVIPVVEFNPVFMYLDELRSAYSDFALFFHDSYGGDVIAVLWKPDIDTDREFQLTNANALEPVTVKGETKYRINKEALIEDFRLLGDGLVKNIVVPSS